MVALHKHEDRNTATANSAPSETRPSATELLDTLAQTLISNAAIITEDIYRHLDNTYQLVYVCNSGVV